MIAVRRYVIAGFTCLALGANSAPATAESDLEKLCKPPAGDVSPYAGIERQRKHIANACRSAYPRLGVLSLQTHWEGAVANRCKTLYASRSNGVAAATYKEACIGTELRFRKASAKWKDKVTKRTPSPICGSSFNKGPDGQKLYSCGVYYLTAKRTKPARENRPDDIPVGPK